MNVELEKKSIFVVIMEKKRHRKLINKLQSQYRLIIYNDKNFQAVWNVQMTRAKVIQWVVVSVAIYSTIVILLICFTPIRRLIPGYPERSMQQSLIRNVALIDSLDQELSLQKKYLSTIQSVISGEIKEEVIAKPDSSHLVNTTITEYNANHDSIFQLHLLNNPMSSIGQSGDRLNHSDEIHEINFFKPSNGIITDKFQSSPNHYGIDIVSSPEAPIFSTLSGTIIFSGFTIETGYVIYIQHRNNLISVYKHNASLLKKTGDYVSAGEAIAIMGNSGELSTGPHLHFELWYKGTAIDPLEYISF
ncbi:MAG: M23 family metallopeptidase [Mangrovibacterium sp.]